MIQSKIFNNKILHSNKMDFFFFLSRYHLLLSCNKNLLVNKQLEDNSLEHDVMSYKEYSSK